MESLPPLKSDREPEGTLSGFKSRVSYRAAILATTQLKPRTPDTTGWRFNSSVLDEPIVPSFAPDVSEEG